MTISSSTGFVKTLKATIKDFTRPYPSSSIWSIDVVYCLLAAANPELLQQASGLRDVLLAAGAVMLCSSIVLSMQMG